MELPRWAWGYLKENWGAPFVVAFIVLLAVSAVDLSAGFSDVANSMAIYAFYSLVIGVVLQIASYVKYGEGTTGKAEVPAAEEGWSRKDKVLAAGLIAVVVLAVGGQALLLGQPPIVPSIGSNLTLMLNGVSVLHEPDNSTTVAILLSATGGSLPYTFTVSWPDGYIRSGSSPTILRTFVSDEQIPRHVNVTLTSSDGQRAELQVSINSTAQ